MTNNNVATLDPASAVEAEHRPETDPATDVYAEAEERVEEARQRLRKRIREAEAAHDLPSRLRGSLRAGRDDVTGTDLASAEFAVERADLLVHAATTAVNRAEAAGPWRPDVAELIAADVAKGLEVDTVTVIDDASTVGKELTVTLRQVGGTARSADLAGALTVAKGVEFGIEVILWRNARHRSADWVRLDDVLERAGHYVTVVSRGHITRGEVVGDRALIDVGGVWPQTLTLPSSDPSTWDVRQLIGATMSAARAASPDHVEFRHGDPVTHRKVSGKALTTTVEVTITAEGGRDFSTGSPMPIGGTGASLAAAPDALVGKPFAGLGRLAKIERVDTKTKDVAGRIAVRFRLTLMATAQR